MSDNNQDKNEIFHTIHKEIIESIKFKNDKVYDKMNSYNTAMNKLNTDVWNLLDRECSSIYNEVESYYAANNLDKDKDLKHPLMTKYLSCRKFFSHDILNFIKQVDLEVAELYDSHRNRLDKCKKETTDKNMRICLVKQYNIFHLEMNDFLSKANRLIVKKNEYIQAVDKYKFEDIYKPSNI